MQISAEEYFSILKEQVALGKEVSMIITGNSMSPFLEHGRDTIYFKTPNRKLHRGDMVFFQRDNGKFVMHRIKKIKDGTYYFIGDNQTDLEGPLSEDHIFALITKVRRKGHLIDSKSFCWFFFAHIWIHIIPLRPAIISCYKRLKVPFSRKYTH